MTDTNQKLREVATELDRLMLVIESAVRHADPRNHASVMALILANKEALALPTADHLPNAGKMINGLTQSETDASASVSGLTAAPVEERAKFDAWKKTMQDGFNEWDAWLARSALSAGDAVDGQSNASRWVASADRYPPEGERVFFMDLATNIVGFDMWAGEGFMWMPSHWMPIPPAPAMRKGQL